MTPAKHWFNRLMMAATVGITLALAGCGGSNVRSDTATAGKHFDTIIQTYKSDQFMLDGAVLGAIDLGSHFAYLKDQGKLPQTVLLEAGDDSKIHKKQRQYMARLSIDYGFKVFYPDGDELVRIEPDAKNARDLYETPTALPNRDPNAGTSARDGSNGDIGYDPRTGQQY